MATTKLPTIIGESLYQEQVAPHRFRLVCPVLVSLSNGNSLHIPAGYVTDFASVPRTLWAVIMPVGRHNLAVLVHDYLLDAGCSRATADRELLYFLKASNVHPLKTALMYSIVRAYSTAKQYLNKRRCLT